MQQAKLNSYNIKQVKDRKQKINEVAKQKFALKPINCGNKTTEGLKNNNSGRIDHSYGKGCQEMPSLLSTFLAIVLPFLKKVHRLLPVWVRRLSIHLGLGLRRDKGYMRVFLKLPNRKCPRLGLIWCLSCWRTLISLIYWIRRGSSLLELIFGWGRTTCRFWSTTFITIVATPKHLCRATFYTIPITHIHTFTSTIIIGVGCATFVTI